MKLAVTGGAGFIGCNFIRYWLTHHPEDEIVNIDKLTYAGNLNNLREVANLPNYRFVQLDIVEETADLAEAIEWCDVIINFAAETHVDRSVNSADQFVATNIVGTHNLLKLALKHNKRFHQIGTDEVYGALALDSQEKFHEAMPYRPNNPYSASKAAADHLALSFHKTHGLFVTVSHCSNNFGPFQHPEKFIPQAIAKIMSGGKVPVYGDGQYVRDWLFVDDHARAIDLIIRHGQAGEVYDIGGMTEEVNNLTVVKAIAELLGRRDDVVEFVTDRPGHDRKYAVDWTKIANQLGYRPQHDFMTALAATVQWYVDNEWWWRPVTKNMKGIILAGGLGTRLRPMTLVVNKHLLPVYDRPMIYYPIQTLLDAGITDIMIVTGSESAGGFMNLLGTGHQFGAKFTYRLQDGSGGIAQALGLCRDFAGSDPVAVILGDNIYSDSLKDDIDKYDPTQGAKIFLKQVPDAQRFGVATVADGQVVKIVEKPKEPETDLAVTGVYLYDQRVWDVIDTLKPSARGELEITDVNNWYIDQGLMSFATIKGFWSDAGTVESLHRAANFLAEHKKKN